METSTSFQKVKRQLLVKPGQWLRGLAPWPLGSAGTTVWAVAVLVALALRVSMFPFEGNDYRYFLGPWFDFIRDHGGYAALGQQFSDYPPAYLYLLTLATYLPFKKIVAIKLLSLPFDLVLAGAVRGIAKERYPNSIAPALAFLVTLFAPTVFINSALWGQCDGIFTAFLMLALLSLSRGRTTRAALLYGVAIAFKLQAIFLAPVFLALFLRRRITVRQLLLIPVSFVLSIIPAALLGRSMTDLMLTYVGQTQQYGELTMGAPNLYQWLPNEHAAMFRSAGILLTMAAILLVALVETAGARKTGDDQDGLVRVAMVSVLLVPFCLPGMHERYFFPADVISIVYAFYFPHRYWLPACVGGISLFSYLPFLLGHAVVDYKYLAIALAAVIVVVGRDWLAARLSSPAPPTSAA